LSLSTKKRWGGL
jgi:hypothetical protein